MAAGYSSVTGVCRQPLASNCAELSWLPVDITDTQAVKASVLEVNPDVIIHAAAANPGNDDAAMWAVNLEASKSIAEVAAELGCRVVFISTDIVHNGQFPPYSDDASADPQNTYGQSKAAGEQAILTICSRAIVTRTSLIYGLDQMDRGTANFIHTLKSTGTLTLFNDVMRQPVWIDSLCNAVCQLAFEHTEESGTINVAGNQAVSRADFALKMLHYWGISRNADIQIKSGFGIPGLPIDCTMQLSRATALGFSLPGVDAVLASARS